MEKYYNSNSYNYYTKANSSSRKTLEITILSGEDLRINRKPIKKSAFVVVRPSDAAAADELRTAEDAEGGSYPTWNKRLVVDAAAHAAVAIEVRCKTAFGEKIVGTASVPTSDFSGGYMPEGYLHFLSYRLRDSRGEKNGVINISVTTKVSPAAEKEYNTCSGSAMAAERMTVVGVPVGSNGVVTGVPLLTLSHGSSCNGNYF